jgi:hypothetical protein
LSHAAPSNYAAAPLAAPAAIGYAGVPALGYAEAAAPIAAAAPAIGYAGVAAQAIGYAGVAAPAIGYAEVAAPLTAVETIQAGPAITQTEVHQGVVGSRTVQASKKFKKKNFFVYAFSLQVYNWV